MSTRTNTSAHTPVQTPPPFIPYDFNDLGDADCGEHVINSSWRNRAPTAESSQQTEPQQTKQQTTQTTERKSIEIQTDPVVLPALSDTTPFPPSFPSFLNHILPDLLAQLDANLHSSAMDDYNVVWEEERESTIDLFVLTDREVEQHNQQLIPASSSKSSKSRSAPLSSASSSLEHVIGSVALHFNCTGAILSVSLAHPQHTAWCAHQSSLYCWNIMRKNINLHQSDIRIEQGVCITSLAHHPQKPSLIAGGMANGEVRLWDLSRVGEPHVARSAIEECFHREAVQALEWRWEPTNKCWQLVSISSDGKILFWREEHQLKYPTEGYLLQPNDVYHGHGVIKNKFSMLGGTCLSFPCDVHSGVFLVSTELGGVLKCALSTQLHRKGYVKIGDIKWNREALRIVESADANGRYEVKKLIDKYVKTNALDAVELEHLFETRPAPAHLYPNPVVFAFDSHAGPVRSIQCSPFNKNIFATCSTDGSARIYHIDQSSPLFTFQPSSDYLYSLQWSPHRPLVFAVSNHVGVIFLYDLQESMVKPAQTIELADKIPILSLTWNKAEVGILAAGDIQGRTHVWSVSPKYSTLQKGEIQILEQWGNGDSSAQ